MHVIQEWHVVLGDTQCRADRTTVATELLRKVKSEYKKNCFGKKKKAWIPEAISEFDRLVKATFPKIPPDDNGRVLVKCTKTAMKRIEIPYSYGYLKEARALYGTAKRHESLTFFLESRDAPTLANELAKHWENLKELRHSATERPPVSMMDAFESTLTFFQLQLKKADEEDGLAARLAAPLLEDLSPINALKRQWKLLCSHMHPCCVEPLGLAPSEMFPIEPQQRNIGYEHKSGLDRNLQAKPGRDSDFCVLNYAGEAAELPPDHSPQEYGTMSGRGLLPDVAIFGAGNENCGVVGVPGDHGQTAELPPDSVGTEHHVKCSGGMLPNTSLPSDANLPDEDDFSFFNFDVSDAFSPDPGHNNTTRTIDASGDGRMFRGPRPPITYPLPGPDLGVNFEDIDLDVLLGKHSEPVWADALCATGHLPELAAQGSLRSGSKEQASPPLGHPSLAAAMNGRSSRFMLPQNGQENKLCCRRGDQEAETVDREDDIFSGSSLGFGSVGSEDAAADAGSVGKRNSSAKPSHISVTCGAREDILEGEDVESMTPDDAERKPQPVRRLSCDLEYKELSCDLEYKNVGRLPHALPMGENLSWLLQNDCMGDTPLSFTSEAPIGEAAVPAPISKKKAKETQQSALPMGENLSWLLENDCMGDTPLSFTSEAPIGEAAAPAPIWKKKAKETQQSAMTGGDVVADSAVYGDSDDGGDWISMFKSQSLNDKNA
jgi:hypothetical protein